MSTYGTLEYYRSQLRSLVNSFVYLNTKGGTRFGILCTTAVPDYYVVRDRSEMWSFTAKQLYCVGYSGGRGVIDLT